MAKPNVNVNVSSTVAWATARPGVGLPPLARRRSASLCAYREPASMVPVGSPATITVFLADDSVIIREGRAGDARRASADLEVVGVAEDYDSLVAGRRGGHPKVVVSDIRMPPHFQREGIDGCKEIRKRHPGTGVVILSPVRRPRLRHRPAVRGGRRLRLPAEGPHRRGRPARPGDPRGGHRRLDARPGDRRRADAPGAHGRAALSRRGRALLAHGRRGQAHQGHRRRPPDDAGRGGRRRRAAVRRRWPRACRAGADGALRRLRHAARGDRRAARSRARRCQRLLPGGVAEQAAARTAARSARRSGSRSPC